MVVVYFDTETGGTRDEHPMISLAAVAMDGDVEKSSFYRRIKFDASACDPGALKVNRYTREAWADAVDPGDCADLFAAWLRGFQTVTLTSKRTGQPYQVARLAGYNAVRFDEPRLRRLFAGKFAPWEYLVRDVLQLVLWHFDRVGGAPENYRLSTVAAYFGIPTDGAHDALADARMCATVARAIREAW